MGDDQNNNERIKLPPILSDPYINSSSSGQEYHSQGSFRQTSIPRIPTLPHERIEYQRQHPTHNYGNYQQAPRFPGLNPQASEMPEPIKQFKANELTSLSSPNPGDNVTTSDPNMDPKLLERRRRNATASAKSRTRRRNREIEMQQRNQFLERQLIELTQTIHNLGFEVNKLKESNSNLKLHANNLEQSKENDRRDLNNLREELIRINTSNVNQNNQEALQQTYKQRFEIEDKYKELYHSYNVLRSTTQEYENKIKQLELRLNENRDKTNIMGYPNIPNNPQDDQYKFLPFQTSGPTSSYEQRNEQSQPDINSNPQNRYSF